MLSPNKQNLIFLRVQKKSFQNGHKLLEEKRNGLISAFLKLSREGKGLEKRLSKEIKKYLDQYNFSSTFSSTEDIQKYLKRVPAMSLSVKKKRLYGVRVEDLNIQVLPPERPFLKKTLQNTISNIGYLFPDLLKLVQIKRSVEKIAKEILKTNCQISNVENKIDEHRKEIRWMENTLQEKENLEKAVLIKIFQ